MGGTLLHRRLLMPKPFHMFEVHTSELEELGLASKLPRLAARLEEGGTHPDPNHTREVLDIVTELRCPNPKAAAVVDKFLVQNRAFDVVEQLLSDGTFTLSPALTAQGFAMFVPIHQSEPRVWDFAHRNGQEDALLTNQSAFGLAPLEGWSFYADQARTDPHAFLRTLGPMSTSNQVMGGRSIADADLARFGYAVEGVLLALHSADTLFATNATTPMAMLALTLGLDTGPGWRLRHPCALQAALLAGWPLPLLAQRWTSLLEYTPMEAVDTIAAHAGWASHLASAHGQMRLTARLSALDEAERLEGLGLLWRTFSTSLTKNTMVWDTVRASPALASVFLD